MPDIRLTIGVDTSNSYSDFAAGVKNVVESAGVQNASKIKLNVDSASVQSAKKQIQGIGEEINAINKKKIQISSSSGFNRLINEGFGSLKTELSSINKNTQLLSESLSDIGNTKGMSSLKEAFASISDNVGKATTAVEKLILAMEKLNGVSNTTNSTTHTTSASAKSGAASHTKGKTSSNNANSGSSQDNTRELVGETRKYKSNKNNSRSLYKTTQTYLDSDTGQTTTIQQAIKQNGALGKSIISVSNSYKTKAQVEKEDIEIQKKQAQSNKQIQSELSKIESEKRRLLKVDDGENGTGKTYLDTLNNYKKEAEDLRSLVRNNDFDQFQINLAKMQESMSKTKSDMDGYISDQRKSLSNDSKVRAALESMKYTKSSYNKLMGQLGDSSDSGEYATEIKELTDAYKEFQEAQENLKRTGGLATDSDIKNVEALRDKTGKLIKNLNDSLGTAATDPSDAASQIVAKVNAQLKALKSTETEYNKVRGQLLSSGGHTSDIDEITNKYIELQIGRAHV